MQKIRGVAEMSEKKDFWILTHDFDGTEIKMDADRYCSSIEPDTEGKEQYIHVIAMKDFKKLEQAYKVVVDAFKKAEGILK
jgi:DnaJ-domain-containing protein 1